MSAMPSAMMSSMRSVARQNSDSSPISADVWLEQAEAQRPVLAIPSPLTVVRYNWLPVAETATDKNIVTDDLPKRSPDLNVLDYSLWRAINVRMRAQEASFPSGMRETQAEFLARLRKTALGLPQREVGKAVQDMRRRVAMVLARNGKLFNE